MAYLSPAFSHDIFISYCHDNDGTGWISHFENDLKILLKDRLREVDIWRDARRLGSNTVFDKEIEEGIRESALFIAITSDIYLESPYCLKELQWFYDKTSTENCGLDINNQRRIFCVLINDIPHTQFPKQFEGMTGREFHDEFSWPLYREETNYKLQLRKLASEIIQLLKAFKEITKEAARANPLPVREPAREQETADPAALKPSSKPAPGSATKELKLISHDKTPIVFMAESSGLFRNLRNRVITELNSETNKINITTAPLEFGNSEYEKTVQARLQKADLTVYLLNNDPGPEMRDAAGKTYFQRQVELGIDSGKSMLIWIPKSLDFEQDVEDDAHREFLIQLEKGNRPPSCRIVRTLPNAITRTILDRLLEIKKAQELPPLPLISGALLNTQTKGDQVLALDVYEALMAKKVNTYLEREPKSPEEFMIHLEDKLKMVNCLIVVYGESDANWVIARLLMVAHHAREIGRPLRKFGIYFAPPRNKAANGEFVVPFLPRDLVYQFDQNDIANPNGLNPLLA